MQKNIFKLKSLIYTLLLLSLFVLLIIFLGKVLLPFLVALILSYIINPFVCYLENKIKLSRNIISFFMSIFIFLLFSIIPIIIIPNIIVQIKSLIYYLPNVLEMINNKILYKINLHYGTNLVIKFDSIKGYMFDNMSYVPKYLTSVSPLASNSIVFIELLVYILLIPFILFYALKNWNIVLNFINEFIPKKYYKSAHMIIYDIDIMLASYLRGQLSVMLVMSIYYIIALNIVGIKFATIIGLMTGILVFVPYIGVLLGLFVSLIIGLISFASHNIFIGVIISFVLGHILEGAIVTPHLVGSRIGLNPIMIIFSLMFFGKLFGFIGVLLALPLTAISVVLLKYLKQYYLKSEYYNEDY